ncbi:MAG: hypothetical protein VKS61_14785 [Candidatus Sericytochromatia bacterium]|nr:hypothetical protein [Candidatus Sericytochromatia bacterium]
MARRKAPSANNWHYHLRQVMAAAYEGSLDEDGFDRLAEAAAECPDAPTTSVLLAELDAARAAGDQARLDVAALVAMAGRVRPDAPAVRERAMQLLGRPDGLPAFRRAVAAATGSTLQALLGDGATPLEPAPPSARSRGRRAPAVAAPPTSATARVPQAFPEPSRLGITGLAPVPGWQLLIDESGKFSGRDNSLVVALLVPLDSELPPLPRAWHAKDKRPRALREAFATLAQHRVGVLGFTLDALAPLPERRWEAAVAALGQWALRLLPVAGKTRLAMVIEQRSEHASGDTWGPLAAEWARQTAQDDPTRAALLTLERPRVIAKDENGRNGYVDLVAYLWNTGRLTELGADALRETWLLETPIRDWDRLWTACRPGGSLPSEALRAFLADPRAWVGEGLGAALYARLVEHLGREGNVWGEVLREAWGQAESAAVDLQRLRRALRLLQAGRPGPEHRQDLGPAEFLMFGILQLQHGNHAGFVTQEGPDALARLCDRYAEDEPELVCQADLVRAVRCTNAFDFEGASRSLGRWQPLGDKPGPRRQLAGRLASASGQHAAFRGDFQAAERLFTQAIATFAAMGDTRRGAVEQARTRIYRALAALDAPGAGWEEREARVAEALQAPVDRALVTSLAAQGDGALRYRHHLLLRHLVARQDAGLREAYLAAEPTWATGHGRPWPQIALLRAVLWLQAGRRERATTAWEAALDLARAPGQGPTLAFVALAMARAAQLAGLPVETPALDQDGLRAQLPLAPWEALAGERDWLRLLARCAPFNFR